jgi:uncharacterized membrane protein YsdA (DUF1294 family)
LKTKLTRTRADRPKPRSPFAPLNIAALLPLSFLLFLSLGALTKHLPLAVPATYAVCSLLSIGMYANDKSRAERGAWRTPESTLHLVDLLGGWPGGILAQRLFRHKNRKLSFQCVFWLCVLAHLLIWIWIFIKVPAEPELIPFFKQFGSAITKALSH